MISVTFYSILHHYVSDIPYPDTDILLQHMLDTTTNHAHKIYNGEDFWDEKIIIGSTIRTTAIMMRKYMCPVTIKS